MTEEELNKLERETEEWVRDRLRKDINTALGTAFTFKDEASEEFARAALKERIVSVEHDLEMLWRLRRRLEHRTRPEPTGWLDDEPESK